MMVSSLHSAQSIPTHSPALVPDISVEDVVAAVHSFRRGSAPGPTGLRGGHLRQALQSAHGDEVATNLALSSPLTLPGLPCMPCPNRPIAVGECLGRLASKCLCVAVRDAAREYLSQLQLGVAVPHGIEAPVHVARHWAHGHSSHPNKCFLTVDFANAFNSVDRAALLREVRLHLPGLAPYAEWCYGKHSRLLFTLLGAAVGHASSVRLTLCRVTANKPLLQAIAALPDPQTALLLLHPGALQDTALHVQALDTFDSETRACLESMCTGPLQAGAWTQACLSTSNGGLGLRQTRRHSLAAYSASRAATAELCRLLRLQHCH